MGFWLSSVTPLLIAAQSILVPVSGVVRDADSGAPLAAVVVSVAGLGQSVGTDEQGRYSFEAPPGTVHVTVARFGYAPQAFDALIPESGVLEINVALRREPILLAPIEVRAPVSIRGLDDPPRSVAFPDRTVSQAAMYQHPFSPEPDAFRALGGGEVTLEPETPSGLHVRGGTTDQVGYLLDGIPVFSPYHSGGTFSAWNADALASVDLVAASPLNTAPDALSGVVSANTRAPGRHFQTRGSVSAMQARATIDGPVGRTSAGYLMSVGSAFPGLVIHKDEPSHLRGDNVDLLAKLESPLLGGRLRLIGYQSRNDVDVAAVAEPYDTVAIHPSRSTLGWNNRSLGGEWARALGDDAALVLRAWSATGDASTAWIGPDSLEHLASSRRDDGAVAMVELDALGGSTKTGVRVQEVESAYSLQPASSEERALSFQDVMPMTTLFVQHGRPLAAQVGIDVSFASTLAMGEVFYSPSAQVSWRASPTVLVSASGVRRQQFGQSLRNPESVVSNIFPVDLYVNAGGSGLPVATSNIGILALEHRPNAWLRLGAQAYLRDFESLALVAPFTAEPYATDGLVVGSGESHGLSLEAGASSERYGFLASYAFQSVEFRYPTGSYAPGYSSAHTFQAGLVLSPSSSYSIRLGFQGIVGRRTTAALGSVEWEACNILDGGCEFAGSQSQWSEALGGTGLPAYYRLDLGARKQWDVSFLGRDGHIAVFGTATNLLARMNVLTVSVDPSTGARSNVDMMPASPLVVGVDWRF